MSAVIRVKRRIDEEPLNAFILNCKRQKLNDECTDSLLSTKDEISTIVKFAATVGSQDETTALEIAKLTKDEAKQLAKKSRIPNIAERGRQEMRTNSAENRFKVVNCYRAITDEVATKEITIVDVEKAAAVPNDSNTATQSTSSSANASSSSNSSATNSNGDNFVYDLYLAETNHQQTDDDTHFDENYFSVRPFDDLVYEDHLNNEISDGSDSEDSNQENYFRNDYPDTDEGSSIGEHDMRRAMNDAEIDSSYDLSSDEEDNCRNGFVYSVDSEAIGFEDDIDYCDINRYGEAFARYKGKSMRQREAIYNDNESDCSDYKESDNE